MAPTLGSMIAAIGSPSEWGAVAVADLMWDNTNKRLGIGEATPEQALHVDGAIKATGDVFTGPWTDWTPSCAWTGFSGGYPADWAFVYYKKIGKFVFLVFNFYGTSNATTMKFTLPFTSVSVYGHYWSGCVRDNGALQNYPGFGEIAVADTANMVFYKLIDLTVFTGSGKKGAQGQIFYEATS